MKIRIVNGLPFVTVILEHQNRALNLDRVLIDTGSAGTLISADVAIQLGLGPSSTDKLIWIRGVGGAEFVYSKPIDQIKVGLLQLSDFFVEIGAMDYGYSFNGILGMDFLIASKAIIDIKNLKLHSW